MVALSNTHPSSPTCSPQAKTIFVLSFVLLRKQVIEKLLCILFLKAKQRHPGEVYSIGLSLPFLLFWERAELRPQVIPKGKAWRSHETICSSTRKLGKRMLCGRDAPHCPLLETGGTAHLPEKLAQKWGPSTQVGSAVVPQGDGQPGHAIWDQNHNFNPSLEAQSQGDGKVIPKGFVITGQW